MFHSNADKMQFTYIQVLCFGKLKGKFTYILSNHKIPVVQYHYLGSHFYSDYVGALGHGSAAPPKVVQLRWLLLAVHLAYYPLCKYFKIAWEDAINLKQCSVNDL